MPASVDRPSHGVKGHLRAGDGNHFLPAWRDKGDGGLCLQKLGDKLRFLLEQPTEGAFVPVTDQSDAEAL